jgi:hypothetical protein
MSFGTRQLAVRLRAARAIVYCQAAILVLTAVFAYGVAAISGQTSFTLSGLASHASISGSGVLSFSLVLLVVAAVLVAVERYAAAHGGGAQVALVVAEVAICVYLVVFVDAAPGGWAFGPAAGAAVLLLHLWPQLTSHLASRAGAPAPAATTEGRRPGESGPDVAPSPPL